MAITSAIPILPVSRSEFDSVDNAVMKSAYAAQAHFGRLCEEQVYENDLKARLKAAGFKDVFTQVELTVSHEGFRKDYRLDLVVNQVLYELKATRSLSLKDEAQALNYAALLGLNRVKLINFGGASVVGKLLGAPFAEIDRGEVAINNNQWEPLSAACENLAAWFERLIRNIGGYLESEIYGEALVCFCGGENACIQRLPVGRGNLELGKHRCRLYCDDCAFVVTGLGDKRGRNNYGRQLQSLVSALPIRAFQWINVHHLDVTFVTVKKE